MEKFIHGDLTDFVDWQDEDGNVINAADGGIIFAEGKYHWYGQALRDLPYDTAAERGGQTTCTGVVMYASEDLYHWRYEGVVLACVDDPSHDLYPPMRLERPKIVYNEKTRKYVLWCHYVKHPGNHGFHVGGGEAGVAVADSVNGPYRWIGHTRPIDEKGVVRDCTLYKDKDGSAYFIYDRDVSAHVANDRCLHIVKLSEDYLSPTGEFRRIDAAFRRESPTLVYHDGYYYMITSALTGWDYNRAKYFRSRSLLGEWEDMGDPSVGDVDGTTFHTQSTAIFPVEGQDLYIHMAERHNTENFLHCSYVWLPLGFGEDHTLSLTYQKEWRL